MNPFAGVLKFPVRREAHSFVGRWAHCMQRVVVREKSLVSPAIHTIFYLHFYDFIIHLAAKKREKAEWRKRRGMRVLDELG